VSWRTTLVLAVLLALVGGTYYFAEVRGGGRREEGPRKVYAFKADDVDEVALTTRTGAVTVKRDGDGWKLLRPVEAKADKTAVQALVTALAEVRRERDVEEAPKNLGDFGLDRPSLTVTVKLKAGGAPPALLLGEKNPTGASAYAKLGDQPAVFLVYESTNRDLAKGMTELRDKTVLAFETDQVKRIELARQGEAMTLEKAGASEWRVAAPVAARADGAKVRELLDRLRAARVKEFGEEKPKALAPLGLDPAEVRVGLTIERDKETSTQTLLVGRRDGQRKLHYAKRQEADNVFLLEEAAVKDLPRLADVRDKRLVTFDRDKAERVELVTDGRPLAFARVKAERWEIEQPTQERADTQTVRDFFAKLEAAKVKAFVAEEGASLKPFGLERPPVRLNLWEKDAKAPKTIALSKAKKDPGYYATVDGTKAVGLLEAATVQAFLKTPADLKDKSLFDLEPKDVAKVLLKRPGLTLRVEKVKDKWTLQEPKRGEAKGYLVEGLLDTLRDLRYARVVSEKADDPAKHGLDPPSLEVTLWKGDGTELATLVAGKAEGGSLPVKLKARPTIYGVDAKALDSLPKDAESLL
jgi:hypothetical protein